MPRQTRIRRAKASSVAQGPELVALHKELSNLAERPLHGPFVKRALRAVAGLAALLSEEVLRDACAAPSDYATLLTALESDPATTLLSQEDPLAKARLRGLAARTKLLKASGGVVGAQEVAKCLQVSRQAVYKRQQSGKLLALDCGRHGYAFPAWQFAGNVVLPGLENTLAELSDHDPWMKLAFFLGENSALGGKTPLEALKKKKTKEVLRAARLYGKQGAT